MKRIPIALVVLFGLAAGGCSNTWDGIKKDTNAAGKKIESMTEKSDDKDKKK